MYVSVLIAVFCVVVYVLLVQEQPISGNKVQLGDLTYRFDIIDAPASTGIALKLAAYVSSKSIFGPTIRRLLMNENKLVYLRELAAQTNLEPLYYPMRRLSTEERDAVEVEDNFFEAALTRDVSADEEGTHYGAVAPYRSIEDYARHYRQGHLPSEVMSRTLRTIDEWSAAGHRIFTSVLPEEVMREALASDDRHREGRPLSIFDGVPVAFKDMMDIKGHRIYNGRNPAAQGANFTVSSSDDLIVKRLRDLGAIVLGVTIMTEGGMSPLGFNVHHQGPTSPYSRSRYSGGSSSGSGVAVAAGLVPVAIGYDSGGSVRIPSSLCHIHGLAATFGRIPFDNLVAENSMIKTGPMAVSARDAALTYAALSPNEEGHPYSVLYDGDHVGPPLPHVSDFERVEDLSDLRVGVFDEWLGDSHPLVSARTREVVAYLESRGATLVPVRIPHMQFLSLAHGIKISAEFSSSWDAINSDSAGHASMEDNSKIQLGIGSSSSQVEGLATEKIRHYAFRYMVNLFRRERLSCIVTPTVAALPPDLMAEVRAAGESNTALVMQFMKYVFLANFVGLPGYSVPAGFVDVPKNREELAADNSTSTLKLPVGVHLLGNHLEEHVLLRIAHSIEAGFTQTLHRDGPLPLFHFDPFN